MCNNDAKDIFRLSFFPILEEYIIFILIVLQ